MAEATEATQAAEPLTVIGAGPVGALLALMLARRGHQVEVYERRPDLRKEAQSAGRSINLAVSTRGLHALSQSGLDTEVLRRAVPMLGRMIHPLQGDLQLQPYGRDDSEFINSMSRGELNRLLMDKAEETGRVRIHFSQRLFDYSLVTGRATLHDERTGAVTPVQARVIFGTDGSASALRTALVEQAGAQVTQEFLDSGYKELTIPPGPPGKLFQLEPHALHIWPRGSFMLIALPNLDGSFTCTLFLAFEGEVSFARLQEPAGIDRFFAHYFPDLPQLIPNLSQAFLDAPLGRMVTVKTLPWSSGGALLLGDAAHAIVPFFGQGMNSGFEDCTVLESMLPEKSPEWPKIFAEFADRRRPDCDAIAELAIENYVEMRDQVADPRFLLHKAVEAELQKRYPGEYLSRYQLVTFSRVPYRLALQAGKVQSGLLDELTQGLTRAEEVDYARAHALMTERLGPLFAKTGG